MKRILIPSLVFLAAFLVGLLCAGHIFISVGQHSLFLLTPDYFSQMFREPFPVTRIAVSFVTQFFDIPAVGPAVAAALVTAVYVLAASALQKHGTLGTVLSCLALACCVWLVVSPSVREKDRHCALEQFARQHQWDKILKKADFRTAEKDRFVIPYALLALNAKGQLIEKMDMYPIKGPQDLDMEGVQTREGYWFSSILDECLGNYNEALHHLFQSGATLNQGMSHITLYQLIRFNIENGNYTLARKYASVLRRNPRNAALAKRILKSCEGKADREDTPEKAAAKVVTNAPAVNLALLRQAGIQSGMANERLAAYMKLTDIQ